MSDIKNQYLIDTVQLPIAQECLLNFQKADKLDELTVRRMVSEIATALQISKEQAFRMAAVFEGEIGDIVSSVLVLFDTCHEKPQQYNCQLQGCVIPDARLITDFKINDVDDVSIVASINELGEDEDFNFNDEHASELHETVFSGISRLAVLEINPKTDGLFKGNILDIIDTHLNQFENTKKYTRRLDLAIGGGAAISMGYNRYVRHYDHVYYIRLGFIFKPGVVKFEAINIIDNVVSLVPEV